MTDQISPGSGGTSSEPGSRVAVGFAVFAAIMMIASGSFQFIAGIVALIDDGFYFPTPAYLFEFDPGTWGGIHMAVGVLIGGAGIGVLAGKTWARAIGIVLAALSATANFAFIPHYPIWSLLVIGIDAAIIRALAAHGGELGGDDLPAAP
jgi:hypothetical protein